MTEVRFLGRIVSVPGDDGFAFIGIGSVTREDGSPHGLETKADIFLHKDDCETTLRAGMEVLFNIIPDRKREGAFRAVGAVKFVEVELMPPGEPAIPGFAVMALPGQREVGPVAERLPVHAGMKDVPAGTVAQVIANEPMPDIPRVNDAPNDEEGKQRIVQQFLSMLFPNMANFGVDFQIIGYTDEQLDREVEETAANYRAMGLDQQVEVMLAETELFKKTRQALTLIITENLVRPDTAIPIRYFPDLLAAVPVLFFSTDGETRVKVADDWKIPDPHVHEVVKYFCDLFPNKRWYDTFQLFNRRLRTFDQYKGETIPPQIARRMRKAVDLFDFVVVATPYHDQAGRDWEDIEWLRAIDPYVLGFIKGIPYFFVLARFSDAGTFPLFNELVADTVEFLRSQKAKLNGFNQINRPYWYHGRGESEHREGLFGDYLKWHVEKLLEAFDSGNLFDWLRGEEGAAKE
jgi:hypothetical protein